MATLAITRCLDARRQLSAAALPALLLLNTQCAAPHVTSDAHALVEATEGLYQEKHQVRSVDGDDEPAEDVLEIVRVDPTHVFVRVVTHFDIGHSCSVFGIATFENDSFVYRTRQWLRDEESACMLRVTATRDRLSITDRGPGGISTCRSFCGARGDLSEFTVSRTHRRAIPNPALLKRSDEYIEAVKEFNERGLTPIR
jgi:hypothetical protein